MLSCLSRRRVTSADCSPDADVINRSPQGLREHPDRAVREQGGREEPAGEGEAGDVSQEEEPAVLRDLSQEQLQLREAVPLPRQETRGVRGLHLFPR